MKNNRGFTLVELLAVIVLIAVLGVVAVSAYRGISESSKQKALEAKIALLKSSAEKWSKENNITYKTTISVNTLVVEGYVSADEVSPEGLATIENPVTGENMICNTIDIFFDKGNIKTDYRDDVKNCKLANQSLVDTNINISVIDSGNITRTGTGSIAKWTNKDVVIIVNSSRYDPKATSISYDFEGHTTTKEISSLQKYTGTNFINKNEAKKYYNVFYIDASLLINTKLIVTYTIPGENSKSREYTIRIDQEEATATIKSNSEWVTDESPITVFLDDGKGSGPKSFYLTENPAPFSNLRRYPTNYKKDITGLEVGTYYIWTEDNAGNISKEYKIELNVNNVDNLVPGCEINFEGTRGINGWYISDVTPYTINVPYAGSSGVSMGFATTPAPQYSEFIQAGTQKRITMPQLTQENVEFHYYCFVKSLAGLSHNNSAVVRIDKTPPTININVERPTEITKTKNITITVQDTYSGLRSPIIRYGYSPSNTTPPNTWFNTIPLPLLTREPQDLIIIEPDMVLNGPYFLWIDTSEYHDNAGNKYPQNHIIMGPYVFDNAPPTCAIVDVHNICTVDGISAYLICDDNRDGSGIDQMTCPEGHCPVHLNGIKTTQNYIIRDMVGNETSVKLVIQNQDQYRWGTCNGYNTCQDASCGVCGGGSYTCGQSCEYCGLNGCGQLPYCPISAGWCSCEPQICYYPTYTCSCQAAGCGCGNWNPWNPWQNNEINDCREPDCRKESRRVYHLENQICDGDWPIYAPSNPGGGGGNPGGGGTTPGGGNNSTPVIPTTPPEVEEPSLVTCPPGEYLKGSTGACATCLANYYCRGGTWIPDGEDHGLNACPANYRSAAGSHFKSDCYINCAENKRVSSIDEACTYTCPTGYHHEAHKVSSGHLSSNCTANTPIFADATFNYTYNESTYDITLTAATNGTGVGYTYTEKSEKNASLIDTNYFTVSKTNANIPYIRVAAKTPVGTYKIVITVRDINSSATKDTTMTVNIGKAASYITCYNPAYTGSEQTLAYCTHGKMTGNNTGLYVYDDYQVACTGDSNHNDSTASCSITGCNRWEWINKADNPTLANQKWTYYDSACQRKTSGWVYTGVDYVDPDKASTKGWFYITDNVAYLGWLWYNDCWFYLYPTDGDPNSSDPSQQPNGKVDGNAAIGDVTIKGVSYKFCPINYTNAGALYYAEDGSHVCDCGTIKQ